jgi:hypothetical protein
VAAVKVEVPQEINVFPLAIMGVLFRKANGNS